MSVFNQDLFYSILNLLYRRLLDTLILQINDHLVCKRKRFLIVLAAHGLRGLKNCICNFFNGEVDFPPVAFDDFC